MGKVVIVERDIAAHPVAVWTLVSDVTRMGEWSPETKSCKWLDGAKGPAVGARFRGSNAYRGRRWFTTCRVIDCEPGSSFAFEVHAGPIPIAVWAYKFETTQSGCRVTETFTDRRLRILAALGDVVLGIPDRGDHNLMTMTKTLSRVAEAAERQ